MYSALLLQRHGSSSVFAVNSPFFTAFSPSQCNECKTSAVRCGATLLTTETTPYMSVLQNSDSFSSFPHSNLMCFSQFSAYPMSLPASLRYSMPSCASCFTASSHKTYPQRDGALYSIIGKSQASFISCTCRTNPSFVHLEKDGGVTSTP